MIRRGNKPQGGLLSPKLTGGEEDFDWSQLNPLNSKWLGGDRGTNPSQTWQNIKDAWGSDGDDSMVRHYTQAGGDAEGLEGTYNQSLEEMDQPYGSATKGPSLPTGVSEDLPEFVASQMERGPSAQQAEHGLDTEANRLKAGREFNPALASLDHQADPSLWEQAKTTASSIGSDVMGLLSSDDEAQVPAAVAQQPTTSPHGPASVAGQLTGSPHDGTAPPPSLLAGKAWEQSGTGDHVGVDPEEGEGLMAKLGGLMSSDSSKTKPLSKGKMAGVKIATDLLTGSNRDAPILAPSAGVKMGRASFPGLLAASQRPVNPRYTPKGLG
jgi:hypothetical protein